MQPVNAHCGESAANSASIFATAAEGNFLSAGDAGADSVFVRNVWKKTCGACPAMPLPGNARTVGIRMGLAINEKAKIRYVHDERPAMTYELGGLT